MTAFNLVDSCAWLEYCADTKRADLFAAVIEDTSQLLVPTIVLHEVYKKLLKEVGKNAALRVVVAMQQGKVVPLDENIALLASELCIKHKLPMTDGMIYATAQHYNATLWTQDCDFAGLPQVEYFLKQ